VPSFILFILLILSKFGSLSASFRFRDGGSLGERRISIVCFSPFFSANFQRTGRRSAAHTLRYTYLDGTANENIHIFSIRRDYSGEGRPPPTMKWPQKSKRAQRGKPQPNFTTKDTKDTKY
jgi:hypothetical protein